LRKAPFTVVPKRSDADAVLMCVNCAGRVHPELRFQGAHGVDSPFESYRVFKRVINGVWHLDVDEAAGDVCSDFLMRKGDSVLRAHVGH
jgi:hypothetical protein